MNFYSNNKKRYLFWFCLGITCYALAEEASEQPINIEADKFEYIGEQEKNGKIIATGNVVAIQDNQKITADLIEYDFGKDILLAKGQVEILETQGYIIDADKVILSDRLKFGSLSDFTILTPDKSTLKGKFANKEREYITDIEKGYYTSCKICEGKSPIWDIKAKSTRLDQDENSLTYKHAIFRVYGVPVLYTPYLSHYTSKAKRKSGFLKPSYGTSTYLGATTKIPYYFNLAPNYDATFKLAMTEKRGELGEGEYRHLFSNGSMNFSGSVTSAKHYDQPKNEKPLDPDIRYHLDSESFFNLPNNNYAGWQSRITSDKTYLQDYGYSHKDFLTSRAFNSAYQKNGFYEVQAISFQNLRPETETDKNKIHQTPMVLPLFQSNHNIHNFSDGSNLLFSSNFLKIHRYAGADTNRLSIKNKWNKDFLSKSGHNFNFYTQVRNDFYHYESAPIANKNNDYTGGVTRTIPEAGMGWSYPLGRNIGSTKVTIEPLANAALTPYTKYNKNIYNEDSPSGELNDANIFSESRYSGVDLVENTSRISYGSKASAFFKNEIDASLMLGQMYREKPYDYISNTKEDKFSDYVGRLKFNFANRAIASYQFTLDKNDLLNKKNEATLRLNQNKAYIESSILYFKDNKIVSEVKNRREVSVETGINDYKDFSFAVYAKKNLTSKKDNPDLYIDPNGFISTGARAKYVNDCITYSASINRDYTQNKTKKENTTIWFDISLKNLS